MRSHTARVEEFISTRKHCLFGAMNLITYEAESAVWVQADLSGMKATRSGFIRDLNGGGVLWTMNGMQIGHPATFRRPLAGNT